MNTIKTRTNNKISVALLLYVFLVFFISACADNKSVSSYTQNISTEQDDNIRITFENPIVSEETFNASKIYEVKASDDIIKINGKGVDATYVYRSTYEILIFPLATLKPNTKYTFNVNLAKLENTLIKDSLSLDVRTNLTEADILPFEPTYNASQSLSFRTSVEFSQRFDMSALLQAIESNDKKEIAKAITLQDDKGADVGFTLQAAPKALFIKSDELPIQEDKAYTLTIKAKYFGLKEDKVARYIQSVGNLEVVGIRAISTETPYIEVAFSSYLAQNTHLENFISIEPDIKAKFSQSGNVVRIDAPFSLSKNYKIRIKEGLVGVDKSRMQTAKEDSIFFHQITPAIAFSQQGIFLPSNAAHKIAFKSMNIKKVRLKVSKIYPNNITAYLYRQNLIGETQYNNYSRDDHYYDDEYSDRGIYADFERLGDEVLKQDFELEAEQNQWLQSEIDLSALKDKKGIFIIELGFKEEDMMYEFPEGTSSWRKSQFFDKATIQKHLIFSNIALIAQQSGDDKLEVMALDMVSNKPLSSVQINAISRKNQTLQSISTDSQGIATFNESSKIMYLDANKDDDNTILRLKNPVSTEGFDVAGEVLDGNTRAYIYTDRGVYRPGESAHINILARADSKPITHPIHISITSPQGKKIIENLSLKEQLFGLFSYTFTTESNAPSGIYELEAKVGGSSFWHKISVENVVPNRIKVEIASPDKISTVDELNFTLQSKYLFGAPASNLKYNIDLLVKEVNFYAPAYKDYVFTSHQSLNDFYDDFEGKLDENGKKNIEIDIDDFIEKASRNLRAILSAKVIESGGRQVQNAKAVDIMLFDAFVGIKKPESRYVSADKEIHLPIIVLSSDTQKPLVNRKLKYTIYHSNQSWWWDYSSYDEFVRSIKSSKYTRVLQEGNLTSKAEPVVLTFTPNQSGELFIEVQDLTNGTKSALSLYASEYGEPNLEPKITALKMSSNKTHYLSDEKAVVTFESIKDSKALVNIIGADKVFERFFVDTKDGQTQFELPLKKAYAPNVYVSVHLLQDYNSINNDRSQRLYGIIPLMVENADSKITIDIDAPKSIRPNDNFVVNLSNKEKKKVAYTLAIVDEGLLDLTDFSSPNPWVYFYKKLALSLLNFDNYDMIIGHNIDKIHQVLKVGGEAMFEAGAKRKDLNQAQRFKPVAFYAKPIMSDDKGKAKFTYTMPSYMGSVRIMAVAVDEKAYGGASQNMQVSAPVAMLPTIPRSLKNGDKFTLAIEVLPTQEKVGKVTLNLKSGDKIAFDKNQITLQFDDKKSQNVYINAQASENHIGQDFIDISLSSKDFKLNQKSEIDILPNNPYTTLSQKFTLKPKDSLTLENPKNSIIGSNDSYVIVSQSPILSIDNRLKWLIRYPYGCIEQTTSSVMPQLFLNKLSKSNFIDKQEIVRNINAGIERIGRFQTSDGGFSYWQGETRSNPWGSAYAGHFLLLAKANGYYVADNVLKNWISYQKNLAKNTEDPKTAIYALYLLSLAGEPQIGLLNAIYENLDSLNIDVSNKWLLGAAYKLAGMQSIAEKITKNLPTITKERDESYYIYSYGSSLRDNAMILRAYTEIYGAPHKEALSLLIQKLESDNWYSTQTLGYSLLALSSTMPASEDKGNNIIDVNFNGKNFKADKGADSIKIPFDAIEGKLSSNNAFPLYINQVWDGILLEKDIQAKSQKIALARSFLDESGNPIDVSNIPSSSTFYMKLTLSNASERVRVNNVAITQNLPSGWEIENTRLRDDVILPKFVTNSGITYTDIRDDKIMWFMDYHGNSKVMFVKINAITPGEYILPPATAEAMYDNSFLANTSSMPVVVSSRER
ncbi:alpha-2-macroglobulin family protein [Helicobacter typhlonius]|uniref:alpha-2-macroglobulin family protein n=1 Tax=Helicobacter typhlonius TaxID=76936 RepID=UPI002FE011F7